MWAETSTPNTVMQSVCGTQRPMLIVGRRGKAASTGRAEATQTLPPADAAGSVLLSPAPVAEGHTRLRSSATLFVRESGVRAVHTSCNGSFVSHVRASVQRWPWAEATRLRCRHRGSQAWLLHRWPVHVLVSQSRILSACFLRATSPPPSFPLGATVIHLPISRQLPS